MSSANPPAFVPAPLVARTPPTCHHTPDVRTPLPHKRLRARVAYDGTNYNGWQFQVNSRSVQAEVERVLSRRMGLPVRVVGASRTDAGVHAKGQAVHFDVPASTAPCNAHQLKHLEFVLNQMLPEDVRISHIGAAPLHTFPRPSRSTASKPVVGGAASRPDAQRMQNGSPGLVSVAESVVTPPATDATPGAVLVGETTPRASKTDYISRYWSSMYDTCGKIYSYRFCTRLTLDPMQRLYYHREWRAARYGFCEDALREACRRFEGTHDFTAYTNSYSGPPGSAKGSVVVNPVRTLESVRVVREEEGMYRVVFRLDGALYRMVRNVMGTVLDVACLQRDVDCVETLFESKDRRLAPKSAPARGLCLDEVLYNSWKM